MASPAKRRPEQASHKSLDPGSLSNDGTAQSTSNTMIDDHSIANQHASSERLNANFDSSEPAADVLMNDDEQTPNPQQTFDIGQDNSENGTVALRNDRHPPSVTTLRETIESQFSLEILLKHRELRLIDQELGKCQVALEQLRRCHIMPYPTSTSGPGVMSMVSSGTGPAYNSRAEHPTPWGIAEGPYSRHYATWLIPDSAFGDDTAENLTPRQAGKGPAKMRGGGQSQKAQAGTSARGGRGSARGNLQSLPQGYPQPKGNRGPMIIKRSTDHKMVKLVCRDCKREDFNSAQGFINHCRIAHKRQYTTHDEAAIDCGQEVEIDELGSIVGETGGYPGSGGLVHPLITAAHLPPTTSTQNQPTTQSQPQGAPGNSNQAARTPRSGTSIREPFRPSPQTPHLSALFARSGRGGDLDEMVTEARRRPEPDTLLSDDDEEDEETVNSPEEVDGHHTLGTRGVIHGGGRLPARMSPAPSCRPLSSKGTNTTRHKPGHLQTAMANTPYSTPYQPSALPDGSHGFDSGLGRVDASPADSLPTMNLSPNTTDAHPAPSLVSDDGDYDNPHSDSETPSSTVVSEDEEGLDVRVTVHDHHAMDIDEPGASSNADLTMGKAHPTMRAPRRRVAPEIGRREGRKPQGGPRKESGK